MSGVYVILEDRGGRVSRISFEAIAAANILASQSGAKPTAIVVGSQTEALATQAAAKDVARVARIEHHLLSPYTADGYTIAIEQFIRVESPDYLVFPHSYQVRDYAPALAARLGCVLVGDVTAIGDGPIFTRQLMQGRLSGNYKPSGSGPCLISVQSGAFRAEAAESGAAEITTFTPNIEASRIRTKPGEPFRGSAQTVDLGSAQLIVAVGRGIREADNLSLVQDLASALGAEIAASRPICDSGWLPMDRQIGSSGQTVAPKVYVALGISGAIQHIVGMKGSRSIIAINKDAEAPIFEIADYGVVGNLFDIVPALTEEVKKAKA